MDRASNAHKHHVTKALVGRIVRAARKDPQSLSRRQEKEDGRKTLVAAVKEIHRTWDEQALGMLTAARVKEQLKARHDQEASLSTIK